MQKKSLDRGASLAFLKQPVSSFDKMKNNQKITLTIKVPDQREP